MSSRKNIKLLLSTLTEFHDAVLHVGDIAKTNILQIGICIVNYRGLFGEWTDHMKLLFSAAAKLTSRRMVLSSQTNVRNSMLYFQSLNMGL